MFFLLFICCQVGTLSIEGSLYIRDPKKNWKQSLVCLKNGYMSVNKERGVQTIPFITSSFCIWRFVSEIEAILFVLLCLVFLYLKSILRAIKSDKSDSEQWPLHKLTLYVGIPAEKATKTLDTR